MITSFQACLNLLALLSFFCGGFGVPVDPAMLGEADPPFHGTIFLDPDLLTSSNPTAFRSSTYAGQASRTMFDRRVNKWIKVKAFLFEANFEDGLKIEVQVNPELEYNTGNQNIHTQNLGKKYTALRAVREKVSGERHF